MDATSINDPTDSRRRYERALLQLAARLDTCRVKHRLVVDDGRGGDRMALVAEEHGELVELVLHRYQERRGTAWLFVESSAAAMRLFAHIAGVDAGSPRWATVQRGCVQTVSILADRLSVEADALRNGFPRDGLQRLRSAFPDARLLVGLRAELRPSGVLLDASSDEVDHSLVPAYGAVVSTPHGPRAARWVHGDDGFELPPAARRRVLSRFGGLDRTAMGAIGIVGLGGASMAAKEEDEDEQHFDLGDGLDCGCDMLDFGACDLGAFDLGSCFDVIPDCSGGIDCVPLDCAL